MEHMSLWQMFTWWPALVMGWPSLIASAVCAALGFGFRKPILVTIGAVLALPFFWLLTMSPRFWYMAPAAAACYFCAAYAAAKERRRLAIGLVMPFVALAG